MLEWSAVTMASHLCLAVAIACAFVNAVSMRRTWQFPSSSAVFVRLEGPIFAIAAALMVERFYYVIARFLVKSELNLWQAHPAPEMLSFSVAATVFWLACAIRYLEGSQGAARRTVVVQTICICTLFASVAWGFW